MGIRARVAEPRAAARATTHTSQRAQRAGTDSTIISTRMGGSLSRKNLNLRRGLNSLLRSPTVEYMLLPFFLFLRSRSAFRDRRARVAPWACRKTCQNTDLCCQPTRVCARRERYAVQNVPAAIIENGVTGAPARAAGAALGRAELNESKFEYFLTCESQSQVSYT